jgi:hypothetical protein
MVQTGLKTCTDLLRGLYQCVQDNNEMTSPARTGNGILKETMSPAGTEERSWYLKTR